MWTKRLIRLALVLGMFSGGAAVAQAADVPDPQQTDTEQTPPRLSFVDGKVSYWRQGADDWSTAQINTPLAPGDEVYTASPANLEVQIGARAFVRAWANTQIGLTNQEPDFLQFKVTAGSASFDVRTIEPGHTVEVDTPNAAFTIEHAGYYRVDVTGDRTSFITRRAGQATVTPASGEAFVTAPSEEVLIEGTSSPRVTSYVAPSLDAWDKWNYARTDMSLDAVSARYVSPGTYGASDLDRYGTWRTVPSYGSVWIPAAVDAGWAPYTTGSWTLDPRYGWTWVDTAPWGWAPYHYGRWVSVDGFWAWAPGPLVARAVYAPALVAFLSGPGFSVGVNVGGPVLGWVALGWGEPIVPWWGRPGFIHEPSWRGWGGPRVVNNVTINNTTVVNVQNINVYRNAGVRNAVVVVSENRFGRGPITAARITQVDVKDLRPTHAAPRVTSTPASFVPAAGRGVRPPEQSLKVPVVATRPPHVGPEPAVAQRKAGPVGIPTPAPRIVSVPPRREANTVSTRPPLGQSGVERRIPDRPQPLSPPKPPVVSHVPPQARREPQVATTPSTPPQPTAAPAVVPSPRSRRTETPQVASPPAATSQPAATPTTAPPPRARRAEVPQVAAPATSTPQPPHRAASPPPSAQGAEAGAPPARRLPGEPANRLSPNRTETQSPPPAQR